MDVKIPSYVFQPLPSPRGSDTWLRISRSRSGAEWGSPFLTSAEWLRVIPVGVPDVNALNDGWPFLQGMAGVTGEFHDCSNIVAGVGGGEVSILNVRRIAVAFLESWKSKSKTIIAGAQLHETERAVCVCV